MATPTHSSFRLTGADGGPLRGDVRTASPARPAIVLCHGFQGFKDWGFFPPLAERLARAGYTAVSFNYSGSGIGEDGESFSEPERFGHNTYSRMHEDLRIVLNELRSGEMRLVPSAIGLLGHSLGGGIALLQTAEDPGVRALVTWAGVSRFGRMLAPLADEAKRTGRVTVANKRTGTALPLYREIFDDLEQHGDKLDALAAARQVKVPWLIVHGAADESIPVEAAEELKAAAPAAEQLIIPGGSHTFSVGHPWRGPTRSFDLAAEATLTFLARHLA